MGFVTNKWQPVSSPGPTPVPTWELLKSGVKATTAFDYSSYDYTEYLIIVYGAFYSVNRYYEFFYIPEFGTIQQVNGTAYAQSYGTFQTLYLQPQNTLKLQFRVLQKDNTVTSSYKYTIYGRKKVTWSLVSDNSSIPNYTELVTANGYYTPFNYQVTDYRNTGGSKWSNNRVSYSPYNEQIYQNAYTRYSGSDKVYTRLSSNEVSWTQIHSTTATVSIADISYTEMFIVGRRLTFSGQNTFQALYVIPEMLKGLYPSGAYTRFLNSKYTGQYGEINISDTQISASYQYINEGGYPVNTFQSIDIYYR